MSDQEQTGASEINGTVSDVRRWDRALSPAEIEGAWKGKAIGGYIDAPLPVWQPIETAPKDGSWVLLRGGRDYGDDPVGPCVVAFWYEPEADWAYAYWDGAWRSVYESPTQWMPIPTA